MFIIDRFEGNFAVIEATDKNGEITVLKTEKSTVSKDVKEGDVLICENGIYKTDFLATEKRREEILKRIIRMKNRM